MRIILGIDIIAMGFLWPLFVKPWDRPFPALTAVADALFIFNGIWLASGLK